MCDCEAHGNAQHVHSCPKHPPCDAMCASIARDHSRATVQMKMLDITERLRREERVAIRAAHMPEEGGVLESTRSGELVEERGRCRHVELVEGEEVGLQRADGRGTAARSTAPRAAPRASSRASGKRRARVLLFLGSLGHPLGTLCYRCDESPVPLCVTPPRLKAAREMAEEELLSLFTQHGIGMAEA
eukprot:scaffold263777_cov40-Tisochrysis_lutea.AAC.3